MSSYRINRSIVMSASRTGRLDLHGLSLSELPADLFTTELFEALTSIDLSGNHLTVLTPEIAQFKRLRCLTLDGNNLTQLPVELAMMQSLKTISLEGNPLPAEIMNVYKRARTSGSNGREAASILAKLVELEERSIQQEERALYGNNDAQHNVDHISIESGSSTPRSHTDSLSEEVARVDARFKQASLQSHVFDPSSNDFADHSFAPSKKHNAMAHTPSTVFTAAHDTVDSHTSKRILAPNSSAKSKNAPFGTDDQPIEAIKPRRMPTADVNEKENDFASLHGFSNNDHNRVVNAGKRMMKAESRPSPFGTIDGKFDSVSSSQKSLQNTHESRQAIEDMVHESHQSKLAAGRSDSRGGSHMGDLMSQRAVNEPGSYTPLNRDQQGVKNFKQAPSDIFHTSRPTSPQQAARSLPARNTSPWATDDQSPQAKVSQSRYHHQTSNVFTGPAEVARTGRGRIQQKQDNGIF